MSQKKSFLNKNKLYKMNLLKSNMGMKTEIDSLREEINAMKRSNAGTKDDLLFEIQSRMDRWEYEQKKLVIESKDKLIENLNNENKYLKKVISEKNELNNVLYEKIFNLNDDIENKNNEIMKKNEILIGNETIINDMSEKISNLKNENDSLINAIEKRF